MKSVPGLEATLVSAPSHASVAGGTLEVPATREQYAAEMAAQSGELGSWGGQVRRRSR